MYELQDFDYLTFFNEINDQPDTDLPEVFSTELDCFPDIKGATVIGQIVLWDLLQKIKYNFLQDIDIDTFLLHKYVNNERNPDYDQRKEQLPAICYNASFRGYKDLEHLNSITNLMFLDIDDFSSTEEAQAYKSLIFGKYDWILSCNLSLSKLGLHVIIKVDKINGNQDYNDKYDYISSTYFDGLLDKSSKSLTRYTVVPYDYNIYINENPNILDIDSIINRNEKGIRSAYIKDDNDSLLTHNKGIRSAHKKEEIIYTPYTFSFLSPLNQIMSDAARKHSLRFRQDVDESFFTDPDTPIYVPEGINVIDVNLIPLRDRKVREGNRTSFIGALTIKMIYLNIKSPDSINYDTRRDIMKFIVHINNTICFPPLKHNEVLKSVNANWKKYKSGEMDFTKSFRKQRAFWSKNASLKGNEKRKVTCRIKNEPIVAESKRKIKEAIETLNATGKKITQKNVAEVPGLNLPLVKKYRKFYKECIDMIENTKITMSITADGYSSGNEPDNQEIMENQTENTEISTTLQNSTDEGVIVDDTEYCELEDVDSETLVIGNCEPKKDTEVKTEYSQEKLCDVFNRVYDGFKKRLDDSQQKELFNRFIERFSHLPAEEARILALSIDDVKDANTYAKQSGIYSEFWKLCSDVFNPVTG